jgi:hypothetical protein
MPNSMTKLCKDTYRNKRKIEIYRDRSAIRKELVPMYKAAENFKRIVI